MRIVVNCHKLFYGIEAAIEKTADAVFEYAVHGVARELFYDPERVIGHRVLAGEIFPLEIVVDDLQLPVRNIRKIDAWIVRDGFFKLDQL